MQPTDPFVKMAAAAEDLQELWKSSMYLKDGDFVLSRNMADPNGKPAIIQIRPGEARDGWVNPVWIPTQTQLKALLRNEKIAWEAQGRPGQKWYYDPASHYTPEELIAIVMHQRSRKEWDGATWKGQS